MEHYELEYAWRRAVNAYHRRLGMEAFRQHLALNPPPEPPPLITSLKDLAWFNSLGQVDVSGLDIFSQGGQANEQGREVRRHRVSSRRGTSSAEKRTPTR
jgi:hypothetical protein